MHAHHTNCATSTAGQGLPRLLDRRVVRAHPSSGREGPGPGAVTGYETSGPCQKVIECTALAGAAMDHRATINSVNAAPRKLVETERPSVRSAARFPLHR